MSSDDSFSDSDESDYNLADQAESAPEPLSFGKSISVDLSVQYRRKIFAPHEDLDIFVEGPNERFQRLLLTRVNRAEEEQLLAARTSRPQRKDRTREEPSSYYHTEEIILLQRARENNYAPDNDPNFDTSSIFGRDLDERLAEEYFEQLKIDKIKKQADDLLARVKAPVERQIQFHKIDDEDSLELDPDDIVSQPKPPAQPNQSNPRKNKHMLKEMRGRREGGLTSIGPRL